jgi:hypothetical protein
MWGTKKKRLMGPIVLYQPLSLIGAIAVLAGCKTQSNLSMGHYTPSNPNQVRIYMSAPPGTYEELGLVRDMETGVQSKARGVGDIGFDQEAVLADDVRELAPLALAQLCKQAAGFGADGVILTTEQMYAPSGGGYVGHLGERMLVEGIAIRFKSGSQMVSGKSIESLPPSLFALRPLDSFSDGVERKDSSFISAETPTPRGTAVALPSNGKNQPPLLEPFVVNDLPVQSFGFSVKIARNNSTQKVDYIIVDTVVKGSPADRAGLSPLTSIRKINGRPVQEFTASLEGGSDMNRILMNRKWGAKVTLEVLDLGSTVPRTVTLIEGSSALPDEPNGVWGVLSR